MVHRKDLFDVVYAEVSFLNDIEVGIEAVFLDVLAKDLHVLLNFGEVCKALLFRVSVLVSSHETDSRVVDVAKDEALAFIWAEVGQAGFLRFAKHVGGVGK